MTRINPIGSGGTATIGQRQGGGQPSDEQEPTKEQETKRDGARQPPEAKPRARRPLRDGLDRRRDQPTTPTAAAAATESGLAMDEGQLGSDEQRAELKARLRELEGIFRFMGKAHPKFESTRKQIEQLRLLLNAMDQRAQP